MTDELQFQPWPPQTRGGQHVGVSFGVLVIHVRTGIGVVCMNERSMLKNRETAVAMLTLLLETVP
jgi:protein subunit release factor A